MDDETFERGLEIRKAVLGPDHVERSMQSADDFNRPYQDMVTEYCWGAVWGRPGLDRKTRSMLNLAMLAALGKDDELKLHIRGAIRNGLTKDDVREVLLQVMIYAGVPAANSAFALARQVFKAMEEAGEPTG